MAVLAARSHEGRIAAGIALLSAATALDTGRVKARLARFAADHRALTKAQQVLDTAEQALSSRRERVAELDVDQDECVDRVTSALIGDDFSRTHPFQGLSPHVPTMLKKLGYAAEAKALTQLVGKARKRKGLSAKTLATLSAAEKAAKAVTVAVGAVDPAQTVVDVARSRRDALVQAWETSFAALKRGARAAEDDGPTGLFAALFERTAAPKKPKKKAAAAP